MYWEWLSGIRLSAGKVQIWLDEDKHLHIKATDYLYRVTLYEVPILAIVSELRNRMLNHTINMTDVIGASKMYGDVYRYTIDEHEYIKMGNGFTHSGTCKKCKKELESTIRKIVKEEHSQW